MAHIEGNVRINASVEDVFSFVADWRNVAECCEGIYDYHAIGEIAEGLGARFSYRTRSPVAGEISYVMEVADFKENRGITFKSVEGAGREERWWFVEEPGWPRGTRVVYDLRYTVPVPVIGGLVDSLLVKKQWTDQAQKSLLKIKSKVEGATAA